MSIVSTACYNSLILHIASNITDLNVRHYAVLYPTQPVSPLPSLSHNNWFSVREPCLLTSLSTVKLQKYIRDHNFRANAALYPAQLLCPLPSQRQNKHEVVELKTRLVQDPPRFRPKDICLFSFQLFKRSSARPELVLERETGAWNKFERITSKKVRMDNSNKLHRALVDLKFD